MAAIERNEAEISPSTLYAVACIEEGVPFVNGSPQNTFVPGTHRFACTQVSAHFRTSAQRSVPLQTS